MRYKAVIFDLDGTLLDTLEDLGTAVNHALKAKGLPLHEVADYRRMVGHGVRNLVMQALPEDMRTDASVDEALAAFKEFYTSHIDVHTRPYPGIPELLRKLDSEDVKMAIASNKFQSGTEYLAGRFFGDIQFTAIFGNREGFPLKPDPEIVGEILRKAGVGKEDAAMVGDSPTDMKTASNGGISGIAVSWGYRDMEEGGHWTVAHSPEELLQML